jgi:hypothetical protein
MPGSPTSRKTSTQSGGRWKTVMKKKKTVPKTADEFLRQDSAERHDETQRILAERIAYHERRIAAERARRRLDSQ